MTIDNELIRSNYESINRVFTKNFTNISQFRAGEKENKKLLLIKKRFCFLSFEQLIRIITNIEENNW